VELNSEQHKAMDPRLFPIPSLARPCGEILDRLWGKKYLGLNSEDLFAATKKIC